MAIQNQGFRRDSNLVETENDRTAFDNLAGSGTNLDISILQNNLRNTSSIPYFKVDNDGFFSTASDRVIEISSITSTGKTDPVTGNKTTTIQVSLVNPFLIKFGDSVKISGITDAGSDIVNGEFSVEGTSNDLKTFSFSISGVEYTATYSDVSNITFSILSQDLFSFTKGDVVTVSEDVNFKKGINTINPPFFTKGTEYYVIESDGLTKFKLSTTPNGNTVDNRLNTFNYNAGERLVPDNFYFIRKDAVLQEQIVNYIRPEIQDPEFTYLGGNTINGAMDLTQANIESAEFFMSKKYRGDKDTTTSEPISFEGSVVINDPHNYNSISSKITDNTPLRRPPGVYIGDTRSFSSDNNPWDKSGAELNTSSEEVSIGELTFLDGNNSMVVTGIDNDVSTLTSSIDASSFTHKIPVKIEDGNGNQETYFLLLNKS
tara:strand:+ start:8153 stop:9445 length:1293 start_codon:yes stop_codon:yes gene_type:complete